MSGLDDMRNMVDREPTRGRYTREQFVEDWRRAGEHGTPLEECGPAELALIAGVLGRVAREIASSLPPDLRESP